MALSNAIAPRRIDTHRLPGGPAGFAVPIWLVLRPAVVHACPFARAWPRYTGFPDSTFDSRSARFVPYGPVKVMRVQSHAAFAIQVINGHPPVDLAKRCRAPSVAMRMESLEPVINFAPVNPMESARLSQSD